MDVFNTLILTAWSGLAVCAIVFTLAKRSVPVTVDEVKVMWVMHRKTASCRCRKWEPIKRKKDKIVGFQCECGYRYTQKRPLVCRVPKHGVEHSDLPAPFSF